MLLIVILVTAVGWPITANAQQLPGQEFCSRTFTYDRMFNIGNRLFILDQINSGQFISYITDPSHSEGGYFETSKTNITTFFNLTNDIRIDAGFGLTPGNFCQSHACPEVTTRLSNTAFLITHDMVQVQTQQYKMMEMLEGSGNVQEMPADFNYPVGLRASDLITNSSIWPLNSTYNDRNRTEYVSSGYMTSTNLLQMMVMTTQANGSQLQYKFLIYTKNLTANNWWSNHNDSTENPFRLKFMFEVKQMMLMVTEDDRMFWMAVREDGSGINIIECRYYPDPPEPGSGDFCNYRNIYELLCTANGSVSPPSGNENSSQSASESNIDSSTVDTVPVNDTTTEIEAPNQILGWFSGSGFILALSIVVILTFALLIFVCSCYLQKKQERGENISSSKEASKKEEKDENISFSKEPSKKVDVESGSKTSRSYYEG